MLDSRNETICAVATAPGIGGIAVIRVSGLEAFSVVDRIVQQKRRCQDYSGHTLHRAKVIDDGDVVDDVLLSIFHCPHSYTGEDVVEISCHGGQIPVSRTVKLLLTNGCRAAGPGEFTERAYLNGLLDLTQAEAVCNLINAKTEESSRAATAQLGGALAKEANGIRSVLLEILAQIEASIDFSEDIGELDVELCHSKFIGLMTQLDQLLATASRGILLRDGAQVVLVGRPNAGKSSLLNALLRTDRAIVTAVPGTTRDTLEESVNIRGIAVRLWDTAGLRDTTDPIEMIGIARTKDALQSADLVLIIVDATIGLTSDDISLISELGAQRSLVVWNKSDLNPVGDLMVSAKNGEGIELLESAIAIALLGQVDDQQSGPMLTSTRQKAAVERCRDSVQASLITIAEQLPSDFLSIDVRSALTAIGEITGQSATEDIINEIFARFCIGK